MVYTVQYTHYSITSSQLTPRVWWKMDFKLSARGAAWGRKRLCTSSETQRSDAEIWWVWTGGSGDMSCPGTKKLQQDRWEKPLFPPLHKDTSHNSTFIFSVCLHLQEVTCVTSGVQCQRRRGDARWLINNRTNQNRATEESWWQRNRGFVKTRGITLMTLLSPGKHITAALVTFLFESLKG